MKILSSIFLAILVFSNSFSQRQNQVKILSWNIYMLPALANLSKNIKKSHKKDRAIQIAEIMNSSDYDIIVFQEAFFIPARKILSKKMKTKYPFQYGPINRSFIKTNSGIFICSKIALKELETIIYKDCDGADCFAKKGVGLFEGEINGKKFQIAGTHLNAGGQEERENQYTQAYKEILLAFQQENIPQFFCGDFNTSKTNTVRYQSMLKKLDIEDIETKSKQINTTVKNTNIIDYILLRRNGSKVKILDKKIRTFPSRTKTIEKLKGTLSDHLAVEITFEL